MTDFIYLFRGGMDRTASPDEMHQNMERWRAWIGELSKTGNFKSGEPLEQTGKTIKGKKRVVTDGPYAEAKDVIGGYLVVSAKDIDDAVRLAQGCPIYENDGSVEVRAVTSM
jgi:hypothetical protein